MTDQPTESLADRLTKEYDIKTTQSKQEGKLTVTDDFQNGYKARIQKLEEITKNRQERASSVPNLHETDHAKLYHEAATVQLDLVQLASDYDGIMTNFKEVLMNNQMTAIEKARLIVYRGLGRKEKAKQLEIQAYTNKGLNLDKLVDNLATILDKEHQTSLQAIGVLNGIRVEINTHMKKMQREVIDGLRNSYKGTPEQAQAESSLVKFQMDLDKIDQELSNYERLVNDAKTAGKVEDIQQYTNDMLKLLDVKDKILDSKLEKDQELFGIRRDMMDMAKKVKSAKEAIATSRLNYQTVNTLIEAYSDMEITFRYDKEHNIPLFKHQAQLTIMGAKLEDMRELMLRKADIAERTMELSMKMAAYAATQSFELLQTSQYDPAKARMLEENMIQYRTNLNQLREQWASEQLNVQGVDLPFAHYQEQK